MKASRTNPADFLRAVHAVAHSIETFDGDRYRDFVDAKWDCAPSEIRAKWGQEFIHDARLTGD